MNYNELINYTFQLESKLFKKMDSYRLIEQKCIKKCFSTAERQNLEEDIHYVFTLLIKTIERTSINLTREDIIFCCLKKSGFDTSIISRCLGSSIQAINQRKYRIRKKMRELGSDFLHNIIFTQ